MGSLAAALQSPSENVDHGCCGPPNGALPAGSNSLHHESTSVAKMSVNASDLIQDCLTLFGIDLLAEETLFPVSGWAPTTLAANTTATTAAPYAERKQQQQQAADSSGSQLITCGRESIAGSMASSCEAELQFCTEPYCPDEAESGLDIQMAANDGGVLPTDLSFDAFDFGPEQLPDDALMTYVRMCETSARTCSDIEEGNVNIMERMAVSQPLTQPPGIGMPSVVGASRGYDLSGWPPTPAAPLTSAPRLSESSPSDALATLLGISMDHPSQQASEVEDSSYETPYGHLRVATATSEDEDSSFGSLCEDFTEDDLISQSSLENRLRESSILAQQNQLLDNLKQLFGSSQRLLSDAVACLSESSGFVVPDGSRGRQQRCFQGLSSPESQATVAGACSRRGSEGLSEPEQARELAHCQSLMNEVIKSVARPQRKSARAPSESISLKKVQQSGTSKFRGVSRHRLTRRWEASLWVNRKQMYLGGYNDELSAARAYDLAALFCKGQATATNFPPEHYTEELQNLSGFTKETLVAHLRRNSCAFSRGKSRHRGVSGHHGRWEARIGQFNGRKNVSFGVHDCEEEAARQYDRALIIEKGERAKTNFPLTDYVKEVEAYRQFLIDRHGTGDVTASAEILETSRRCILPFKGILSEVALSGTDGPDSPKRAHGSSKATVILAEQLRQAMARTKLVP